MTPGKDPIWWDVMITEYLRNGQNIYRAYMAARPGTTPKSASVSASHLLRKPRFKAKLEKAMSSLVKHEELTRVGWLKSLQEVAETKTKINSQAKMRAYELIGKACGWLSEEKSNHVDSMMDEVIKIYEMFRSHRENPEKVKMLDVQEVIDVEELVNCEVADEDSPN